MNLTEDPKLDLTSEVLHGNSPVKIRNDKPSPPSYIELPVGFL